MKKVKIYSRTGCHLCEIAIDRITSVKEELNFNLEVELIDSSIELQQE
ncbi:MAG: glutaredoxin family protein, partial [Actinobacteria bacterium]|nr:glutaredoxin family protein [Actinomycetota bacterium]